MGQAAPTVYLSSDHAGAELRLAVGDHLAARGFEVKDLGPASVIRLIIRIMPPSWLRHCVMTRRHAAWRYVEAASGSRSPPTGFLGARGAGARRDSSPAFRQHNDANVIALGQRLTGIAVALDCVDSFMETEFEGGAMPAGLQNSRNLTIWLRVHRRLAAQQAVQGDKYG